MYNEQLAAMNRARAKPKRSSPPKPVQCNRCQAVSPKRYIVEVTSVRPMKTEVICESCQIP